ncbi:hypothetical protein [Psychrobacillus sp. L3]|uniref:hypothetical protein n=1 Tax=Psychrobacillus sp. L3 TaxID=3236891 RepID=UPI0036F1FFB1
MQKDFGLLEKITNKISNDQLIEVETDEVKIKWEGTSTVILDPNSINCGKCSNCGG